MNLKRKNWKAMSPTVSLEGPRQQVSILAIKTGKVPQCAAFKTKKGPWVLKENLFLSLFLFYVLFLFFLLKTPGRNVEEIIQEAISVLQFQI